MSRVLRFPAWAKESAAKWNWLKDKAEVDLDEGGDDKLRNLYSYLRWSEMYRNTHYPDYADEHTVAKGMITKYYRLSRGETPSDRERQEIAEAERLLAASNEEIRRRKAAV